ncbi:MAG: POTRA domain-containing protein [Candidatus Latescibacterota bacterium]
MWGRQPTLGALALVLVGLAGAGAQGGREIDARQADGKRVAAVRFTYPGEKVLKSSDLRSAMRIQEGDRFSRRFFNGDMAAVVDLYRARGYREAEITRRRFSVDGDGRVVIEVELDSGALWRVADVRVEDGQPMGPEFLEGLLALRPGEDLNYGLVLEGERALQTYLNRQGYPHATVSNKILDHLALHTADVVYRVAPGRRMYFGTITLENPDSLHTSPRLVERYLTFDRGDLYNPEELVLSRNALTRTGLFRTVFLATPQVSGGDSLQPVHVRLDERKYLSLGATTTVNATRTERRLETQPHIQGTVQHSNWLGRGARLGLEASWGEPLQGATAFMMERDVLRTGADLTFSLGLTEEWGRRRVQADPDDARQYDLLTENDTVLWGILLFAGEADAREYIQAAKYDYTAIERLWEVSAKLTRRWGLEYYSSFSVDWTRAWNRPDPTQAIGYTPGLAATQPDAGNGEAGSGSGDTWDDWDDWGDDTGSGGGTGGTQVSEEILDYSEGKIPATGAWQDILAQRSRAVNFTAEVQRDTRDDRISPTRGTFARFTGLYAIKLGARPTSVVDGEVEARRYWRLSNHFVLAGSAAATQAGSLRRGRPLPGVYWKRYGGEGSVRGVNRESIEAVGGGRLGINLRGELRFQAGPYGLVGFWDRANVWRHAGDLDLADLGRPSGMVDGYGAGLRYSVGFPFRLDLALNDGFSPNQSYWIYFSIGQAF